MAPNHRSNPQSMVAASKQGDLYKSERQRRLSPKPKRKQTFQPNELIVEESSFNRISDNGQNSTTPKQGDKEEGSKRKTTTQVIKQSGKPDLNVTIGEDFVEFNEEGEAVEENGQFDARVNQSVIESDYSSDYDDEDENSDQSRSRHQQSAQNRGFMKGCYVPQEVENDLEY